MEPDQKQRMIAEWGLGQFSPEEQDVYIDKIGQALYQSVVLRASDTMSEAEQDALDAYLQQMGVQATAATLLEYLSTHLTGFDQVLAEETAKLKTELTSA